MMQSLQGTFGPSQRSADVSLVPPWTS